MGQNFDKALGIPKDMEHRAKYKMIIEALGYEDVKKCIPFTIEELKKAYKRDRIFNNLPLKMWDTAAGFSTGNQGVMSICGSRLTNLYREKCNVNMFSCSDGVCILKECARMWVEDEERTTSIKAIEDWKKSDISNWTEYCKPGDLVDEEVFDYFLDILPPRSFEPGYLQVGEPYSHEYNPETGKYQGTYSTFTYVEKGIYKYCGTCFVGKTEHVPCSRR